MQTSDNLNVKKDLDLRRFYRAVRKFWWLYLVSVGVLLAGALIYAKTAMPQYTSHATLMIEESDNSAMVAAMAKSSGIAKMMGLGSCNADDELVVLQSNPVMKRVISEVGMNVTYINRDGAKSVIYPVTPVVLDVAPEVLDTLRKGYTVKMRQNGDKFDISVHQGLLNYKTVWQKDGVALPVNVKFPGGGFRLDKGATYAPGEAKIDIVVTGSQAMIEALSKKASFAVGDKRTSAINLELEDPSPERGRAFLDNLMELYQTRRAERRKETAQKELEYCNNRIALLSGQLSQSESKVEDFKRRNNTFKMKVDSAGWIARSIGGRDKIEQSQNQLTYYDRLLYILESDKDNNSFLPAMSDGTKPEPLVEEYNAAVAERRELERSATPEHPAIQQLNKRLSDIHRSLVASFTNKVELSRRNLESLYGMKDEASQTMAEVPGLERELTDLLRDRTIKNELYLYLLQRREAAELKLSATDSSAFVVEEAYTDVKPSMKKILIVLFAALALGLLIPTLWSIFYMQRTNKVKSKIDTAFIGLESHTFEADDEEGMRRAMRLLRRDLTSIDGLNRIFVADFPSRGLASLLQSSLTKIGVRSEAESPADNDSLTRLCADTPAPGVVQIVKVPQPEQLDELTNVIKADGSALVVGLAKSRMKRPRLHALLRGLAIEDTFIFLFPKK